LQERKMSGAGLNYFVLFLAVFLNDLSEHDLRFFYYLLRLNRKERLKIEFTRENLQPFLNSVLEDEDEIKEKKLSLINFWLEKYNSTQSIQHQ
ncbi:MAG: hypothetical protein GX318_08075, partial [Clostridia bacterium]|nr:hypothetical protein [Clostridia bacterium]